MPAVHLDRSEGASLRRCRGGSAGCFGLAGAHGVAMVLDVMGDGGVAHADRVGVGRVPRGDVTDGGLLGVLRIAGPQVSTGLDRAVIQATGGERGQRGQRFARAAGGGRGRRGLTSASKQADAPERRQEGRDRWAEQGSISHVSSRVGLEAR